MSKPIVTSKKQSTPLPLSAHNVPATKNSNGDLALRPTREVAPLQVADLPANYLDLNKIENPPFSFKQHLLPISIIMGFALFLVVLFHLTNPKAVGREISGQQVSADYEQEKVCVDHPDGSQSCTTRTKVRKSYR